MPSRSAARYPVEANRLPDRSPDDDKSSPVAEYTPTLARVIERLATLWTATTSDWVHSSPAVANGVVYIGNEAGDLYAFNAATGGLIWQKGVSHAGIFNGPTVANGVVYVAAEDGKLYAINAATGRVLFRGSVPGGGSGQVLASPTVDGGNVFVPAYDQSAVTAFALRAQ